MTTTPPDYGGCQWPTNFTPAQQTEWDGLDATIQTLSLNLASSTLERLTGYRVGNCPVTVRPCRGRPGLMIEGYAFYNGWGSSAFYPAINEAGFWVNFCPCVYGQCACNTKGEVHLPGPVGRVDQVLVDGAPLATTDYRIDNGSILVWTGAGDVPWPDNQDLSLPTTAVGTFAVTYLNAYPVDSVGAMAAGILALEFARAFNGNKCRLPAGVTAINRQGISMEIPSGAFPGGMTGIREVDSFIAMWNPNGLRQQPKVWSPDVYSPRVSR